MSVKKSRCLRWPLLLVLAVAPIWAQRQPHTFFKNQPKLSDSDIQKIDRGEIVTKVLDSSDQYGLLVFGAVYVKAPIEKFADVYRDVEKLQQEKVYLVVKKLSDPPRLSDFDRFAVDRRDIDTLQSCKPGDCDIQVMNIEEFQRQVNWNAPNKYAEANAKIRARVFEGVDRYMKGGLRAMGSYRDRSNPLNLYRSMKDMVDGSQYIRADRAADIRRHVVEFPSGRMAGAEDIFYWENIDFGQGPVARVNHVTIFPDGFGVAKVIAANKQLYASKYMRMALQMYYCVPDTQNTSRRGF